MKNLSNDERPTMVEPEIINPDGKPDNPSQLKQQKKKLRDKTRLAVAGGNSEPRAFPEYLPPFSLLLPIISILLPVKVGIIFCVIGAVLALIILKRTDADENRWVPIAGLFVGIILVIFYLLLISFGVYSVFVLRMV